MPTGSTSRSGRVVAVLASSVAVLVGTVAFVGISEASPAIVPVPSTSTPPPRTTAPPRSTTTSPPRTTPPAPSTSRPPAPTTTRPPTPSTANGPTPTSPPVATSATSQPPVTASPGPPVTAAPATQAPSPPSSQANQHDPQPPCQPDAVDDHYTLGEFDLDIPYDAGLGLNDVFCPGQIYTIEDLSDPPNGTVTKTPNAFGAFYYFPEPGFFGPDSFTYTLYEDGQPADQATVDIDVTPGCTVVGFQDYYETDFETQLDVPAPGVLDNDTFDCLPIFSIEVQAPPSHGSVTLVDGTGFSYVPEPGFTGFDQFTYHILNPAQGVLGGSKATLYVMPPGCEAVDDAYSTDVDTPLDVAGPGVRSNDDLSCAPFTGTQLDQAPSSGTVTVFGDGSFEYVPDAGFVGQDSFTYELYGVDPFEVLASATVTIDVTEPDSMTTTSTTPPPDETTDTSGPTGTSDPADPTTTTTTTTTTITVDDSTPSSIPDGPTTTTTPAGSADVPTSTAPVGAFRVATFNASLNRGAEGELLADLSTPDDQQARNVAEVLQRTRPDIVLLNEFDHVEGGAAVDAFRSNYLLVSQGGLQPLDYPYAFIATSNTGVPSGLDLDGDGTIGGPGDAFGFGEFPGQYGMVVLSRFPILDDEVRTFEQLPWASMPGARLPDDPTTPEPADWYSPDELAVLRLSSKSHWDVPIDVDGRVVHVLASHPTPPVFDGPEDRNGLRNADEIAFWADYVAGTDVSWIVDDAGTAGGLDADAEFVIVGDLNSDSLDGDSSTGAVDQLLALDRVQDPAPTSAGGTEAALVQGQANTSHLGEPALDTADFADDSPGNLRVDYVLPSAGFEVVDAGVFWPVAADELSRLVTVDPPATSDHRLVWVDLA